MTATEFRIEIDKTPLFARYKPGKIRTHSDGSVEVEAIQLPLTMFEVVKLLEACGLKVEGTPNIDPVDFPNLCGYEDWPEATRV
jgi:hypothetical protein